jgi:ABC-2 type transport system permease protein
VKVLITVLVAALLVARIAFYVLRRRRSAERRAAAAEPVAPAVRTPGRPHPQLHRIEHAFGDVGLVAGREIRERVRGRIFRVGTIIMLVGVGAAVVIPTIHSGSGPTPQRVGVVGGLSSDGRQVVAASAKANDDTVTLVNESSTSQAKADLRAGRVDAVIVDSDEILLDQPVNASASPADSGLVNQVAQYLGVLRAYREAGLTASQVERINRYQPVAVSSLVSGSKGTTVSKGTSVIGMVLLFFMLTQYCTWILIGVMQEKSSRVVEVLLAVVRPIQLLGGKVLGIGAVALGQAALIVGFALAVGAAVGSDLLHGAAPLALLSELLWLVLGYGFYCWVYAAAGSTAERQDQVQTLALPLSLPILFGYIYSISVVSSGNANAFFKVLAFLPPTAPFCMSALVGLGQVTWWQFVLSALISVGATAGVALFAARIYRRAVLRTGSRVRLRELLRRAGSS